MSLFVIWNMDTTSGKEKQRERTQSGSPPVYLIMFWLPRGPPLRETTRVVVALACNWIRPDRVEMEERTRQYYSLRLRGRRRREENKNQPDLELGLNNP